jgi:hypothetical protein
MVTNKDIKETRRSGSDKEDKEEDEVEDEEKDEEKDEEEDEEDKEEDEEEDEEKDEDRIDAPLDKEDVEWLLDQAPEYNAYEISKSFVLFTKTHNDMRETPVLSMPALNDIEDFLRVNIAGASKGEDYTELFELACKFTPSGRKLSFAPGKYSFAASSCYMLEVTQLKRSDSSSDDTSKQINTADENTYDDTSKQINPADDNTYAPPEGSFILVYGDYFEGLKFSDRED